MNKPYLFLDTLSSFSSAKTCWPTCTRLFDVRLYFSRKHQIPRKASKASYRGHTLCYSSNRPQVLTTLSSVFAVLVAVFPTNTRVSSLFTRSWPEPRSGRKQQNITHQLCHTRRKKERCNDLNPTPHWKNNNPPVNCVFISPWVYMANRALKSNPPPTLSYNPAASASETNKNVPWKNTPTKTDTHPHWGCQVNQRSLPRMPMSQRPHRLASRMMEDRVLLKYSKRAFWRSVCMPSSRFRNLLMFW